MTSGGRTRDVFLKILLRWEIFSINVEGLSGGLVFAWNTRFVLLFPYIYVVDIQLIERSLDLAFVISVVNCYGPYSNFQAFWDGVKSDGVFSGKPHFWWGFIKFIHL